MRVSGARDGVRQARARVDRVVSQQNDAPPTRSNKAEKPSRTTSLQSAFEARVAVGAGGGDFVGRTISTTPTPSPLSVKRLREIAFDQAMNLAATSLSQRSAAQAGLPRPRATLENHRPQPEPPIPCPLPCALCFTYAVHLYLP